MTFILSKDTKAAILIVDLQKCNYYEKFNRTVDNVKKLIEWGRKKGIKIIYALDSRYPEDSIFERLKMKKHCIKGTEDIEILEPIKPTRNDIVVEKRMLSAFFATDLDFTLRETNIRQLIIAGVAAEACVLKTALDAFELGYDVLIPIECINSLSEKRFNAALTIFKFLKFKIINLRDLLKI